MGYFLVVMVILLSLLPISTLMSLLFGGTPSVEGGDKMGHILAYLSLMFWFAQLQPRGRYWRLALGFCLLGIMLELGQGLLPIRHFEPADMLANCTGIAVGWLLCLTPLGYSLAWVDRRLPGRAA